MAAAALTGLGRIQQVSTPTAPQKLDQRMIFSRCATSSAPWPFSRRSPNALMSALKAGTSTLAIHSSSGAIGSARSGIVAMPVGTLRRSCGATLRCRRAAGAARRELPAWLCSTTTSSADRRCNMGRVGAQISEGCRLQDRRRGRFLAYPRPWRPKLGNLGHHAMLESKARNLLGGVRL